MAVDYRVCEKGTYDIEVALANSLLATWTVALQMLVMCLLEVSVQWILYNPI